MICILCLVCGIGIGNRNTYSHFSPKMSFCPFQKIPVIGIAILAFILTFSNLIKFSNPL